MSKMMKNSSMFTVGLRLGESCYSLGIFLSKKVVSIIVFNMIYGQIDK